jgi:hypothetical protein
MRRNRLVAIHDDSSRVYYNDLNVKKDKMTYTLEWDTGDSGLEMEENIFYDDYKHVEIRTDDLRLPQPPSGYNLEDGYELTDDELLINE